jgi:D-proline reductase (dithiol) PrdB
MVRLAQLDEASRSRLLAFECPVFDTQPWVTGPPLAQRRVAIISTAGLHRRDDRPFTNPAGNFHTPVGDYRIIPGNVAANDLVMSHVSVNYDRTGFQQDWNVVFPLDRLHELAQSGRIGSVADFHYSFMGATEPKHMEPAVRTLAKLLLQDHVNAALLVPV